MTRLLFDTESDGFLDTATKVHCIAIIDVDTKDRWDYKPHQIPAALDKLDEATVLIGHNIQRHDIPLLTKLYGWSLKPDVTIRDTMICARVIYPNVKATDGDLIRAGKMPAGRKYAGKHTLAAWGFRLGEHKGDYATDKEAEALTLGLTQDDEIAKFVWGEWSPDMHNYMVQDCETNLALWDHLRPDDYAQDPISLEHRIARVCDAIEAAGVPFDVPSAGKLHGELIQRKAIVEKQLIAEFGSWQATISPSLERSTFVPKRDNAKLGYTKGVPVVKYKTVTFNPGSRDHIAKVLADKGWKATKFTEGGKPQIDEEVVAGIVSRFPEFSGLGEYLMLDKRISQLADGPQAWLNHVKDDGRIHGVINPMGTITSRCSHFLPNLAQVPNMSALYGERCRELFHAPKGWSFLGADMSGLELRGLAHYLALGDGGRYMKLVVDGDPHWTNTCTMGLSGAPRDKNDPLHTLLRDDAGKTVIYAMIYGAGDGKLGEIIYNTLAKAKDLSSQGALLYAKFFPPGAPDEQSLRKVGRKIRTALIKNIQGFELLQEKLKSQVENRGYVPGLDGRKIPTRSEHSALNFLIQSAGAILCKRWACDAFEGLCTKYTLGKDFQFVLFVHDELQLLVREGLEKEIGEILTQHARAAGEPYGFRGPLDSSSKTGASWAATH